MTILKIIVPIYLIFFIWEIVEKKLNTKERIGERYENYVDRKFKHVFGCDSIKNVIIPSSSGGTTEIDRIFVTTKGIFCIEAKHRKGLIDKATFSASKWYISGTRKGGLNEGKKTYSMYNPFIQNKKHIDNLVKDFDFIDEGSVFNIVVTNNDFTFIHDMRIYGECNFEHGTKIHQRKPKYRFLVWDYKNKRAFVRMGRSVYPKKEDEILDVSDADTLTRAAYRSRVNANGQKYLKREFRRLPDVYSDSQAELINIKLRFYEGTKETRKAHKNQFV